jgi:hypothetical protein
MVFLGDVRRKDGARRFILLAGHELVEAFLPALDRHGRRGCQAAEKRSLK